MLGNFLNIDYIVVCFIKLLNSVYFLLEMMGLSSKQAGSQASRRVTRRLAWIQPVCISINANPALKGLTFSTILSLTFSQLLASIVPYANSLGPNEKPNNSASHPDPAV